SARDCQRIDAAVHPRTEVGPTASVPLGDVVGGDVTHQSEVAANVEVTRTISRRGGNGVVRAGKAAHADPVGVAEGRGEAQRRADYKCHRAKKPHLKEFDFGFHKTELRL